MFHGVRPRPHIGVIFVAEAGRHLGAPELFRPTEVWVMI